MGTLDIKSRLSDIAGNQSSKWLEKAKWREANQSWLEKSADIALKILRAIREEKISQKDLAERLGVSA
jgi:DNA-binding transcriptional regulator YiaG